MKKFWSIILILIALLSVIMISVSAEEPVPAFKDAKVLLSDSIGLKFTFQGLAAGSKYTIKLSSSEYEFEVPVTADENGEAYAIYDALTPAMMDLQVTATLLDTDVAPKTVSVKQYCDWALNNMDLADSVHALVADLVNYAAAAKTYLDPENPTAADLTALQRNLISVVPVRMKNFKKTEDQTGKELQWTGASPVLRDSVAYRFRFTVADTATLNGLNFTAVMGDKTYQIKTYKQDSTGYYVDFTTLTPADLMKDVVLVARNADGAEISVPVTISLDRYTSWVRSDSSIPNHDELCALLNATLSYASGAQKYDPNQAYYTPAEAPISVYSAKLTAGDAYRMGKITLADYEAANKDLSNLQNFAPWFYAQMGWDASVLAAKNQNYSMRATFSCSGSTSFKVNSWIAKSSNNQLYYDLLVEDSWGGTGFTNGGVIPSNTLSAGMFKAGDILNIRAAINTGTGTQVAYYTAIYMGDGTFYTDMYGNGTILSMDDVLNKLIAGGSLTYTTAAGEQVTKTYRAAQVYFIYRPGQLAKSSQSVASNAITRADMEKAISEVLWAYYSKGEWAQYESTTFNAISYTHGGYSPLGNHLNTLEDATEQNTLYSVCSNYAWCAYYEALGYPLFGNYLNPASAYVWIMADQVAKDAEGDGLVVMRWHNYPCDDTPTSKYWDYDDEDKNSSKITHSPDVCCGYGNGDDYDQKAAHTAMVNFFKNYEENLRPGDIIRLPGHVVVYAGDGWILEAGGGKYDKSFGFDSVEADGVINATRIEDYFFPEDDNNSSFRLAKFNSGRYGPSWEVKDRNLAGICVLRPLNQLTIGHNDNPGDDVLNPSFFNTGTTTLPWQLEIEKEELSHTGYNIQSPTFTRMLYPMMNINRTVNVGAYGTAVKGGTITYSVEIRNQSNDAKYITTRINGYTGEDYIGVPITEIIPANVEFVSATGDYTLQDGVLNWKINVPAGQTVKVSYTVRVTGEMGAEIVNGGGSVGTIPSNILVNTIGGQNLSGTVLNNLLAFYDAGKSSWNSNDGYKISASIKQDGSVFAEQIYRAAGLDLDLPELNDLLKILFSREFISISQGAFVGYNKSAESWMFTLNDKTADPQDQVWRDMLINGNYFGGKYVWTNNLTKETRRVSIPRTSDLQAGDFIIGMDISYIGEEAYAYNVTDWKVIFYLGNDQYASLTSDGVLSACDGPRELIGSIVWDVFVGLRPSQAYENVNEKVYSGSPASLTAADMAWKAKTYSAVGLNTTYADKIAGFSHTTKIPYINEAGENSERSFETGIAMIGDVYAQAGLDINSHAFGSLSYKTLNFLLFNDLASSSDIYTTYGHEYHRLDQPVLGYENIYSMLMYYDGEAYVDEKPLTSMSSLQVGDAIVLGRQIGKITQVMIYQGNGQFLVSTNSPIGGFYLGGWLETKTFANVDALLAYLNGYIVNKNGNVVRDGKYWEGYLVLRPSRGYDDINTSTGKVRDVADGQLTDAEKLLLSRIDSSEWGGGSGQLSSGAKWFYSKAKIDVTSYITGTVQDGQNNLNKSHATYMKMLVPGSRSKDGALKLADYQIGDIFCGRASTGTGYWIALYQGNGRFLITTNSKYCMTLVFSDENPIDQSRDWIYYYVLRPSQLAPNFCGDNLTWDVDGEGTLTISGTGAMDDFKEAPWYDNWASIKSVVIEDGATSIGAMAFSGCTNLTSVTIPNSVTSIGVGAFYECSSLSSISIPSGVTSIENFAFYGCTELTSVTIPNGVTSIGVGAFSGCANLSAVTIPSSVTDICEGAFAGCSGLQNVTYGGTKAQWREVSVGTDNDCLDNATIRATDGIAIKLLGSGTCGDNLTWELNKEGLLTIFGTGDMGYDDYAPWYEYRDAIKIVVIENGVTGIGDLAFADCTNLTSITIPKSVTNIGNFAFLDCANLTHVYYDGMKAQWNQITIEDGNECLANATIRTVQPNGTHGDNLTWVLDDEGTLTISCNGQQLDMTIAPWYEYCEYIRSAVIKPGSTSIAEGAFAGCTNLTSVSIPNSVTVIRWLAFSGCTSLTDVYYNGTRACWYQIEIRDENECLADATIHATDGVFVHGSIQGFCGDDLTWKLDDEGNLTISGTGDMYDYRSWSDEYAPWYEDRNDIKTVVIENGVTTIGISAFEGCTVLTSVSIPNSVTTMEDYAFYGCTNLSKVNIPDSVTSIGIRAFEGCTDLTSVTLPNNATYMDDYAFKGCIGLKDITIPDRFGSIGYGVFEDCTNLTSITIPASVTYIEDAFYNCTALTDVYYYGTKAQWNQITIEDGNECLTGAKIHYVIGRELTQAEKDAIASVTVWDFYQSSTGTTSSKSNLHNFIQFVYKNTGIDVTNMVGGSTVANFTPLIFNATANNDSADVNSFNANPENACYVNLVVDDAVGGSWVDFAYDKTNKVNLNDLSDFEWKVGDIIGIRSKTAGANTYLTAVYQGNGQFLLNSNSGWCDVFTTEELLSTMYGGTLTRYNYTSNQTELTEATGTTVVDIARWNVFYVLRPSQVLE